MRYTIRKKNSTTAILGIESSALLDPARKPEVWRFFHTKSSSAERSIGTVLGREPGKTCAMIVHVRIGDLICVSENLVNARESRWRFFIIDSGFGLTSLDLPNRCITRRECDELLHSFEGEELDQLDNDEDGLRELLAQKHPKWLQTIMNRQIQHWRNHKPEKYFRLAPVIEAGGEGDISRCVEESPYAALSRFLGQLDQAQIASCMERDPMAAVMFVWERIPPHEREKHLYDFAKEAISFAADKLSEDELALAAKIDPFTAFRRRKQFSPSRHAILLAHSYMVASPESAGGSLSNLHEEVCESITLYPNQWRASDSQGFPAILHDLMLLLEMKFSPAVIRCLLETTSSEDQLAIANFIALRI